MSRPNCEICEDPRPNIFEPKTDGFYCATCYNKYKSSILCDCDGSCQDCQNNFED